MDPEQVLYDAIVVNKQRPELYDNEGSYTFYPWTLFLPYYSTHTIMLQSIQSC